MSKDGDTIIVHCCSRCRQDHVVVFREFKDKAWSEDYSGWAMCPNYNEPMFFISSLGLAKLQAQRIPFQCLPH